jgi:hypothetical protein
MLVAAPGQALRTAGSGVRGQQKIPVLEAGAVCAAGSWRQQGSSGGVQGVIERTIPG